MKTVIKVLILIAVVAAIVAVTGLEHGAYVGNRYVVTYHSAGGRVIAAVIGVICGIAAYGCIKRRMYAWRIVTGLLVSVATYGAGWLIWEIAMIRLDSVDDVLKVLVEGAEVAATVWFLIGWWLPQKEGFNRAKQDDDA